MSEQVTHFRNGERKHRSGVLGGLLRSLRVLQASCLRTDHCKACLHEHHERHMYVIRNRSGANYSRITCIIRTKTGGSIPNNRHVTLCLLAQAFLAVLQIRSEENEPSDDEKEKSVEEAAQLPKPFQLLARQSRSPLRMMNCRAVIASNKYQKFLKQNIRL